MAFNRSGPETSTVAVEGGARGSDQLASEIDSENTKSADAVKFHNPKRKRRRRKVKKCRWVRTDGGRRAAGYDNSGHDGGCVPRAIAIATGKPYREVLDALTAGTLRYVRRFPRSWIARWIRQSRNGRGYDPARGCYDKIYGDYLEALGWQYTPVEGHLHLRA